jgi:HEAT repeat protein
MRTVPVLLLLAIPSAFASAQTTPRQPARQDAATLLGRGWTALGAQQPAKALDAARQLLQTDPASHDAQSLAIAALSANGEPIQGLDSYEKWLSASKHEDVFLVRPIALSLLRQLAANKEPRIRFAALAALAAGGDADAGQQIQEATQNRGVPVEVEAALAEAGDPAAIGRLEAQVTAKGSRDPSAAIHALAGAGSRGSVAVIIGALKHPAPPARMAAASALAELEATAAIPALKQMLQDPDPPVRNMAAVALARLGDPSGGITMQQLEAHPVGEFRLLAARAAATGNPEGAWVENVKSLLGDIDPGLRIKAARLLLEHNRETDLAGAALSQALADPTPAVRTEAARTWRALEREKQLQADLASVRRLLRDRSPEVQIEAAAALLDGQR